MVLSQEYMWKSEKTTEENWSSGTNANLTPSQRKLVTVHTNPVWMEPEYQLLKEEWKERMETKMT